MAETTQTVLQCTFEFAPGVRCQVEAGHDEPYYSYIDRGQTGFYSDILTRGSQHQVVADPQALPNRSEWTGDERKDTVPGYPRFQTTTMHHARELRDLLDQLDARAEDAMPYTDRPFEDHGHHLFWPASGMFVRHCVVTGPGTYDGQTPVTFVGHSLEDLKQQFHAAAEDLRALDKKLLIMVGRQAPYQRSLLVIRRE